MQRAIGLRGAIAINAITMIGIGPLVTIPLVLASLGGPLSLIGWIGGALVALCDGLVWAELSSRFPGSGGTYVYLREAFGANRLGRALSFLFNWQFLLAAPCLLASGYIGFANYAAYLAPNVGGEWWFARAVALGIGVVTIVLLYRRTATISRTSIVLAIVSVATLALIICAALPHANFAQAFHLDGPIHFNVGFLAGFGSALFVTLYDYAGYSDVALLGDEVAEPNRTIPRAILWSLLIVFILYVSLQIGVLGAVPWHTLFDGHGQPTAAAQYVGAFVVERAWGSWPARIVTALVLVTAFASLYGNLLGFSRIPYAAAKRGDFIPYFDKLHPTGDFPHRALLGIGALSLVACFFTLDQVIAFLTAGIALIQGIAQVIALIALRGSGEPAPYRMPLFPLPAIVAFVGWSIAMYYTGFYALGVGVGWLLIGVAIYLVVAAKQHAWPFALLALIIAFAAPAHTLAAEGNWNTWNTAKTIQENGNPVFTVDGKPFFVYGAAFFYERTPRDEWDTDLRAYHDLGINTIDLYLIWNWHEPTEGTIDFTGETNPQRDLHTLFTLIHKYGFKVIVRPGPVIRNEWKNGGYPDWLLKRPEYNMPLHDILEGRYPATATLQNAHADAAAAEWMANATHERESAAWLRTVLLEIEPWSHDVLAIALDDDQGAYIDNDTWPAPHWHDYIKWLKLTVQQTVGPRVPLFINTYQMKVTASAPVWAWGNWYQSDAYRIGDHDIDQLMFSTALLQTQPGQPVMASEFQAGWLQGADEIAPRAAAPENTTIALHELLQMGAHGVVNFPVQDTVNPAGWEAPWANRSYAWGAALTRSYSAIYRSYFGSSAWYGMLDQYGESDRYLPTRSFGAIVTRYGPLLATMHPKSTVQIAWPVSAYAPGALSNEQIGALAATTISELQECRNRALTCRLVDLKYASAPDLARVSYLVLPRSTVPLPQEAFVNQVLLAYRKNGGRVFDSVAQAQSHGAQSSTGGLTDSTLLLSPDGTFGVLDVFNATQIARKISPMSIHLAHVTISLPSYKVAPGSAVDMVLNLPLRAFDSRFGERDRIEYSDCNVDQVELGLSRRNLFPTPRGQPSLEPCIFRFQIAGHAIQERTDQLLPFLILYNGTVPKKWTSTVQLNDGVHVDYGPSPRARYSTAHHVDDDGSDAIRLENQWFTADIVPDAGARAFLGSNNAIGDFRDGVQAPPTPSPRDYIAAYTHPMDAGTFNRPYACDIISAGGSPGSSATLRCTYDASDLAATPVHFQKTFTLGPDSRTLVVTMQASAPATSTSVILDNLNVLEVPATDVVTNDVRKGYRIETVAYPANTPTTLRLTLPAPPTGPQATATNPP